MIDIFLVVIIIAIALGILIWVANYLQKRREKTGHNLLGLEIREDDLFIFQRPSSPWPLRIIVALICLFLIAAWIFRNIVLVYISAGILGLSIFIGLIVRAIRLILLVINDIKQSR